MKVQNNYSVNPNAESIVNVIAGIFLWGSIIAFILTLIAGLFIAISEGEDAGWIVVACSVLLLPSGFISWAFLKVFVNISRSLYNINEKVAHIDNKVGPAEGSYTDLVK